MTPQLKRFLKRWLKWAEAGGQDREIYNNHFGLCTNASLYDCYDSGSHNPSYVANELKDLLFEEFGASYSYPFGGDDYGMRSYDGTQHLCPKRLAWVKSKLEIE